MAAAAPAPARTPRRKNCAPHHGTSTCLKRAHLQRASTRSGSPEHSCSAVRRRCAAALHRVTRLAWIDARIEGQPQHLRHIRNKRRASSSVRASSRIEHAECGRRLEHRARAKRETRDGRVRVAEQADIARGTRTLDQPPAASFKSQGSLVALADAISAAFHNLAPPVSRAPRSERRGWPLRSARPSRRRRRQAARASVPYAPRFPLALDSIDIRRKLRICVATGPSPPDGRNRISTS